MFGIDNINEIDARNLNPQSLAFVGDAVFSLYIRQMVVLNSELKPNAEHSLSTKYVKASGQSEIISVIENILNEDEMRVYKRARNYKTNNIAKNAKVSDYKRATGFEALLGYLYLSGKNDRLLELMQIGYSAITKQLQGE